MAVVRSESSEVLEDLTGLYGDTVRTVAFGAAGLLGASIQATDLGVDTMIGLITPDSADVSGMRAQICCDKPEELKRHLRKSGWKKLVASPDGKGYWAEKNIYDDKWY